MKKLFYTGLAGLALFEILKVYFIMPMPGSQQMDSIDVVYFLYRYRWYFRIFFGLMILAGSRKAFQIRRTWLPVIPLFMAGCITYLFNFQMTAESMFKQPRQLIMKPLAENNLPDSSVVIGVAFNNETRGYPVRYIAYHHQVQDTIGGKPMIVTYCSVCRTGRVFEPVIDGHHEKFRLVGMDHFNAMFEDATTGSWWRQVNGEAITGSQKGKMLPEVPSFQLTIKKLFEQYPNALVMQSDEASKNNYDSLAKYERGKSKGSLTRTDSLSWKEKSWIVGLAINEESKAYDWNLLKELRCINDSLGGKNIALVLSSDNQSFAAFERPEANEKIEVRNDTLFSAGKSYDFTGRSLTRVEVPLKRINAYQEFWHSWRTFHPLTKKF